MTSYLRQWTQLIRLHGRGVAPVQPYSCPEMLLYCGDTPPVQSDQLCSIGADMTSATSLSLSIYNLLLYDADVGTDSVSLRTKSLFSIHTQGYGGIKHSSTQRKLAKMYTHPPSFFYLYHYHILLYIFGLIFNKASIYRYTFHAWSQPSIRLDNIF